MQITVGTAPTPPPTGGTLTRNDILTLATPPMALTITGGSYSGDGRYGVQQPPTLVDVEIQATTSTCIYPNGSVKNAYLHKTKDHWKPYGQGNSVKQSYLREHYMPYAPGAHNDMCQSRATESWFVMEDCVLDTYRFDAGGLQLLPNGYPSMGSLPILIQCAEGSESRAQSNCQMRRIWTRGGNYAMQFQNKYNPPQYNFIIPPQDLTVTGWRIGFDCNRFGAANIDGACTFTDWSDNWLVDPISWEPVLELDDPFMPEITRRGDLRALVNPSLPSEEPPNGWGDNADPDTRIFRADGTVLDAATYAQIIRTGHI